MVESWASHDHCSDRSLLPIWSLWQSLHQLGRWFRSQATICAYFHWSFVSCSQVNHWWSSCTALAPIAFSWFSPAILWPWLGRSTSYCCSARSTGATGSACASRTEPRRASALAPWTFEWTRFCSLKSPFWVRWSELASQPRLSWTPGFSSGFGHGLTFQASCVLQCSSTETSASPSDHWPRPSSCWPPAACRGSWS